MRGTYFTADGTEIAICQWTQEMKDTFHDEQWKLRDIYSGTKLKWPAWVMIALGVIGMVALANTLYEFVDGGNSKNTAVTELRDNVKVRDE